jgi:hypothetical protein
MTDLANPFPGLRSYRVDESETFFGREGQSDAMADLLAARRFVAVVGESGCGKSSLVRAGLLPLLNAGLLTAAASHWRFVDLHPGDDPLGRLGDALNTVAGQSVSKEQLRIEPGAIARTASKWAMSSRKSLGAAAAPATRPQWSTLILVDQFEELFNSQAIRDEKAAFVELLLTAAAAQDAPVYVVITMRSDYIGECAKFRGLPEIVSRSQYLVPRLTRDQLRQAIEGPIKLKGASIESRLVQTLLNESGTEPDQLPVLQHVLMRTWNQWLTRKEPASPISEIKDYAPTGRLDKALSMHADEALQDAIAKLGPQAEDIARRCFVLLRERDASGREVRRPTKVSEMLSVTGASLPAIRAILEQFTAPERTFLTSSTAEIKPESEINVTHESFFRKWSKLADAWTKKETNSRRIYRRLVERATEESPEYLRHAALYETLEWWDREKPTPAWAERYHAQLGPAPTRGFFETARDFLTKSQKAEKWQNWKRTAPWVALLLIIILIDEAWLLKRANDSAQVASVHSLVSRALMNAEIPGRLNQSVWLGAESLRRQPSLEAQALLSQLLPLMPQALDAIDLPNSSGADGTIQLDYSSDGTRIAYLNGADDVSIRNSSDWTETSRFHLKNSFDRKNSAGRKMYYAGDYVSIVTNRSGNDADILEFYKTDGTLLVQSSCESFGSATMSRDGKTMAVACIRAENLAIEVWDSRSTTSSPAKTSLFLSGFVSALSVSDDGKHLALIDGDSVQFCDIAAKKCQRGGFVGSEVLLTQFAANSYDRVFVVRSGSISTWHKEETWREDSTNELSNFGRLRIRSRAARATQNIDPTDEPELVASMSDKYLIVGNPGGALMGWNLEGNQVLEADAGGPIADLAGPVPSQEDPHAWQFAVVGKKNKLQRWMFQDNRSEIASLSEFLSHDLTHLFGRRSSRTVLIHSLAPDGPTQLVTAPYYLIAASWDMRRLAVRATRPASPNTIEIAVRDFSEGRIGNELWSQAFPTFGSGSQITQFSPDGQFLASLTADLHANEGQLIVRNAATGSTVGTVLVEHIRVRSLTFTPDSKAIILSHEGTTEAYTPTGQAVGLPDEIRKRGWRWAIEPEIDKAALSAATLNTEGSDSDVFVWKYPDWSRLAQIHESSQPSGIRFAPNTDYLLAITAGGIDILDWKAPRVAGRVPVEVESVGSVGYLNDNRILSVFRGQASKYVWRPEDLIKEACGRLNHTQLTEQEWKRVIDDVPYSSSPLCPAHK